MTQGNLSQSFTTEPYWITSAPQPKSAPAASLPKRVDVVIVGAGLTGVSAAAELAKAGRDVLVLDAKEPGYGASSRNAGMLGRNTKHSFLGLVDSVGTTKAVEFFQELQQVFCHTRDRIHEEDIACQYQQNGRFVGALTPAHFDRLAREYEARAKHLGEDVQIVRETPESEMGSPHYVGGVYVKDNASLHPALYTRAMIERAKKAGAKIEGWTPVTSIKKNGQHFTVQTPAGHVEARDVFIATNGYGGNLVPYLNRRLLPIETYIVATEELSPEQAQSILPHNRTYIDNTRRPMSIRLSPCGRRLLFGARTGVLPGNSMADIARTVHSDIAYIFPQLHDVKISNAWGGRCGVTWDMYPHVGTYEGMHYALGYCFSGLAMAPWLGEKAARRILRTSDTETSFAERRFPRTMWPARAFDSLAARMVINYYGWADHTRNRKSA